MLKNYIKVAFRNIRRNPGFALINIFGLALGMGVSIVILLYIQYELRYDTYHDNSDRIVRVSRAWFNEDGETSLHLGHAAPPFGPKLAEDFDGVVEEAVRFFQVSPLLTHEEHSFVENRFFFADSAVFDLFSWNMIKGDPAKALTFPDGLVITQSAARKYFGEEDPMGKAVTFNASGTEFELQVRGVVEDIPANSHFRFDFLASMEPVKSFYGGEAAMMNNYGSNNFATYLLLRQGYDYRQLQEQLPEFIDRHMPPHNGVKASQGTALTLWPLTDIHLHSHLDSEIEANSSIEYVYIFTAIALFILLIACINFMNLSTARSARRAMEVGLRKVIGADRSAIIRQFFGESIILAFLALLAALVMVVAALPYFNDFMDTQLGLNLLENRWQILGMAGIVLFVGLVAGSYPALFLSSFQPSSVMKGTHTGREGSMRFRSALVVTQFAISIGLIISLLVVSNQLEFMKTKDLGFDRENIAVLPTSQRIASDFESLRERLLAHPGILNVSISSRVPSGRLLDSQGTSAEVGGTLQNINLRIADIHVSHNFMETFGMEIIAGRDFDFRISSDSTEAFILNEAAVEAVGWQEAQDAVGKQFHYGSRRGRVIGVVRDFHFESLHQRIAPMVFLIPENRISNVAVKFRENMRAETLSYLEEQWTSLRPGYPFTYSFVEDRFNEQYHSEERLGQIFAFFGFLAIVIAALGLLGLTAFTAQQRLKEIGIRKVFGATLSQIILLLSGRFLALVLCSLAIAAPVAWLAMNRWLDGFAYHISVSVWNMVLAGGIALIIAWITISYQAIKAGLSNPVKSLRAE